MRRASKLRRFAFFSLLVACGSRTGLFGADMDVLVTVDASVDAKVDFDGGLEDARSTLDARPSVDVFRDDCPDAEATLIYTITDDYELQSFDPDTGRFRDIGRIACPAGTAPNGTPHTPFSMAVDRRGTAFVLFRDERLYRVSTATGACIATSYQPRQSNFGLFGMGFATNSVGPTEALYIAGDDNQSSGPTGASGLARITPGTFALAPVGEFEPLVDQAELTGTGDGRLYAFYKKGTRPKSPPSYIGEIDTATGRVIGERRFDTVDQGRGWAFAYWGGAFYMFHAPGGPTRITRWRPSDDSVTQVATSTRTIVGAGVSTCAPQQ